MRWRALYSLTAFVLAAAALFSVSSGAAASTCANQDRRLEQGQRALALPDCRAYELVSPGSIVTHSRGVRSALDGNALSYFTTHPADDAASSSYYYLSTRGAGGWTVQAAAPQNVSGALWEDECDQNLYFSPDLSLNLDEEGWAEGGNPKRCKRNDEVLAPGESNPTRNVFLHDVAAGSYRLLNVTPAGVTPANAKFQDASDDFSEIFFSEEAPLTSDALTSGRNFYVWKDGTIRLLTVLEDGTPAAGELVDAAGYWQLLGGTVGGSGLAPVTGAVSADGSRAFFYAEGKLYLRRNPAEPQSPLSAGACIDPALACTVQIDASQGPDAGGGGIFWRASRDGSRVFFTAENRLTPDATAAAGRPDLYEYDVGTGALVDLTVSSGDAADVLGVAGAAEDGSRIYFVANGVLAPGASPGSCEGEFSAAQTCNLYVLEGAAIRFIAALSRQDEAVWQGTFEPRLKPPNLPGNASAGGRFFAFPSFRSLTGYDSRDPEFPEILYRQIFVYDAAASGSAALRCVSCPPGPPRDSNLTVEAAVNYASSTPGGAARWRRNAVLDDGTVLFDSEDSLVPADVNEAKDVYLYREGQLHLLSGGDSAAPSRFRDATPNGEDVFLSTPQTLLSIDVDEENTSMYDARVNGGFPQPAPPAAGCEGDGCRGAATAPSASAVPTSVVVPQSKPKATKHCRKKRRKHCRHRAHRRHGKHRTAAKAKGQRR